MPKTINTPLEFVGVDDFIENFIKRSQQNAQTLPQKIRLHAGNSSYEGTPLNIIENNNSKHVLLLTSTEEPKYIFVKLSQVEAISVSSTEATVDNLFTDPFPHYNKEATPSVLEINNKAAALEIKYSSQTGLRWIKINWASKASTLEERYFIHAILRSLDLFFNTGNSQLQSKIRLASSLNSIHIHYDSQGAFSCTQQAPHGLIISVGRNCKVSRLFHELENCLSQWFAQPH